MDSHLTGRAKTGKQIIIRLSFDNAVVELHSRGTSYVVEFGVAKHTLGDTQDRGVQFLTPVGPRELVPNKDPDVSERPSFIHPTVWLRVSNLFVVYDRVSQQVGARRTNKVKGGEWWLFIKRGCLHGNLTGAAWPQLQSPFVICREGSL